MLRRVCCLVLALTVSCASKEGAQRPDESATSKSPPLTSEPNRLAIDMSKPMPPGLDEAAMDLTADPCGDFYQYACGGWMKTTEIPADKPLNSRGFVAISDRNELMLRAILDDAAAGKLPADAPFAKQLGDYYASCMDEPAHEKALPEVKAMVKKYGSPKNAKELATSLGALHAMAVHPLFDVSSMQDLKDSTAVIAGLDQSGLGLPDRDYYTNTDEKTKQVRDQYQAFVEEMFTLYGEKPFDAKKSAATIMAFETRLAQKQQTKVERRDPQKLYNRLDRAGLVKEAGAFAWDAYFAALGAKDLKAINVSSPTYLKEVAAVAKEGKAAQWKTYLTWVILRSSIPALPKRFQDASFAFSSKALTGAKADRPRWKKCVSYTDGDLGEALGREFVRRHFGADGKERTSAMVAQLQKSFEGNLEALKWMDPATREKALEKVRKMVGNNKIGYPEVWRDYSQVKTRRDSFLANSTAANQFEVKRQLAKIGKPVDRTEWLMSPPMVNAYYEPQKNEIVFPAGILQPPFFNREATDAVNFGSMGMVVGHEITHGFDDEGRQFDADGNLKDWWTEGVAKDFVARAACVKEQFDNYVALEDIKVKGDLTLGENVADLGGLKLAHKAMTEWYAKQAATTAGAYRYDPSQQFFLGFAQSWCTKVRPEMARLRAATDPHAPPYWRVVGPLGNLASFQTAFACKADAKMIRPNRCEVW